MSRKRSILAKHSWSMKVSGYCVAKKGRRFMSDVLVSCENVGKKFCRDLKKSLWYGMMDSASDLFRRYGSKEHSLRTGEFWANKDISFEVRRGECVGLIGRNGAGKTTLLKMLSGLIKPDCGTIRMKGSIGSLIALGAGFNPILTGRENIYVYGSILGLRKRRISNHIDDILSFAELEEFADAPVRSYSSGMQVRLGFATAALLIKPDVLLLDEVLAVGDFAFRNKCLSCVAELLNNTGVILVSHQEGHIRRICTSALWLSSGSIARQGPVSSVLEEYQSAGTDSSTTECFSQEYIDGISVDIEPTMVRAGESCRVTMQTVNHGESEEVVYRVVLKSSDGTPVAEWNSENHGKDLWLAQGKCELIANIESIPLRPGSYEIEIEVRGVQRQQPIVKLRVASRLVVRNDRINRELLHAVQL